MHTVPGIQARTSHQEHAPGEFLDWTQNGPVLPDTGQKICVLKLLNLLEKI